MNDEYPNCPICGDPIDYCQGHGSIIEPEDEEFDPPIFDPVNCKADI